MEPPARQETGRGNGPNERHPRKHYLILALFFVILALLCGVCKGGERLEGDSSSEEPASDSVDSEEYPEADEVPEYVPVYEPAPVKSSRASAAFHFGDFLAEYFGDAYTPPQGEPVDEDTEGILAKLNTKVSEFWNDPFFGFRALPGEVSSLPADEPASQVGDIDVDLPAGFYETSRFGSRIAYGPDGEILSESKGVRYDSRGGAKMAHQRRVQDRARTFVRERDSYGKPWRASENLRHMDQADVGAFTEDFEQLSGSSAGLLDAN